MSNQRPLKRSLSADDLPNNSDKSCPLDNRKRNKKFSCDKRNKKAPLRRSVRLRYLQPPIYHNSSSSSSEPGPSTTSNDYDTMSTSSESEDSFKMSPMDTSMVTSESISLDDDSDVEITDVSNPTQNNSLPNENVAVVNSIPPQNETTNNLSQDDLSGEVSVTMPTFHEMMAMRYSLRGRVVMRPPTAVAQPRSNVPLHHSQIWLRQHREMETRRRHLLLSDSLQNFFTRWEGISEFLHSANDVAEVVDLERRSLHVLLERIRHEWISATPEMINNHTVSFRYTTSHKFGNQVNCVICLSNFQLNESMRRLPCVHLFHQDCIDRWLLDNRCCPICRNPICTAGSRGDSLQETETDSPETEVPSESDE